MDDLSIDIDSLALDGQAALDAQRVAAAIRAQTAESLDADVLSQASRAVIESIQGQLNSSRVGVSEPG